MMTATVTVTMMTTTMMLDSLLSECFWTTGYALSKARFHDPSVYDGLSSGPHHSTMVGNQSSNAIQKQVLGQLTWLDGVEGLLEEFEDKGDEDSLLMALLLPL
eukprot:6227150-Amphidinium_carterae.1